MTMVVPRTTTQTARCIKDTLSTKIGGVGLVIIINGTGELILRRKQT